MGPHSPSSWMRFSVVWYSQWLTTQLKMKKFHFYIDRLRYGNRDLSGNPGKKDGLTESWLSSSLKISPLEQLEFIEKLAYRKLPFSQSAQLKTKDLLKLPEESLLSNGYSLYGKTGTDVDQITRERRGYWVGFAEKEGKVLSIVIHLTGDPQSEVGGIYAKKKALEKIQPLIQ